MLACLVVDDDVDAEQGHAERLPQWPGQLSDDIITGWLRHSFDVLSLILTENIKAHQRQNLVYVTKDGSQWQLGHTVVKSEDDSGLETLWLLKKIAFLSEKETEEKRFKRF